ncbi:mycofactocin biosynthesis peptidyl-dipeptidase MftE [Nocardioides guangzhouensis]|uniref:Mycofactocin biosynthesis peptidyl-dipeptidase MftE n=1 Tax=Nocardioides guangzhouensis TaxID=2497878 RepID=A0A4Q4ZBX3_9ACTN|nr:mycofactocin biosynthesis peptidyl-dipeptidase MftE [Nocardioides guangzhouensis]RYP84811.1 mycofactocin biosynthesis peptidyl-dipeptidase MftE [Nocardioides guangzhouensis]
MTGPTPPAAQLSLAQLRWPTLEPRDGNGTPLVLVPVGSLEQHGPHLPLGTDTMIASAVTRAVADQLHAAGRPVVVAPALSYGASGEHEDFPGTISIGHDVLLLLLVEYARSACRWAEGVIFVNGHGGHVGTVARAVEQLRDEGQGVAWTACAVPGGDAHAGRTETSVMRCIAPWAVQVELAAAGATEPVVDLMPRLRLEGVRAVSPNGVLGDATTSSVEEGREVFAAIVARVARELFAIDVDPHGRLREAVPQP